MKGYSPAPRCSLPGRVKRTSPSKTETSRAEVRSNLRAKGPPRRSPPETDVRSPQKVRRSAGVSRPHPPSRSGRGYARRDFEDLDSGHHEIGGECRHVTACVQRHKERQINTRPRQPGGAGQIRTDEV